MDDKELIIQLEKHLTLRRKLRFDEVLSQRTRHFTVAVEDVYQLHNTSAVLRSCDVFGIQDVHIIEERNTKRIDREIALGAQKWINLYRYQKVNDCMNQLRSDGYQIVATSPHASDSSLLDFDFSKKSCFFFGRETEGLSEQVLQAADCQLKIPMVGFTESLNISVSAAIILQHVTSKLRRSHVNWQLSQNELDEIKLHWIKQSLKNYDALVEKYLIKN